MGRRIETPRMRRKGGREGGKGERKGGRRGEGGSSVHSVLPHNLTF